MHIIPSRGRPHLLQQYFDIGKPEQPGVIVLDKDDDYKYRDVSYPLGWHVVYAEPMLGFVAKVNLAFEAFPGNSWYTIEGDDMLGRTPHWDTLLAREAARGKIVWGNDLYFHRATHPYIYGDYCRDLGWVAHPAFKHLYVDAVWEKIALDLGIGQYMPEVITEARHYSNFKIPYDTTAAERMEKDDAAQWIRVQSHFYDMEQIVAARMESLCR